MEPPLCTNGSARYLMQLNQFSVKSMGFFERKIYFCDSHISNFFIPDGVLKIFLNQRHSLIVPLICTKNKVIALMIFDTPECFLVFDAPECILGFVFFLFFAFASQH